MDLGNIRPAMEVVGSDGVHLGTVDHVDHNRIKLRRNDLAAGGQHHWVTQDLIAQVDGGTVRLACSAEEARRSWMDEAGMQSPMIGRPGVGAMGDAAAGTPPGAHPDKDRSPGR